MRIFVYFFLLCLIPLVSSTTIDDVFNAASYSSDNANIGGVLPTTIYSPLYGDSAPRNAESEILVQAPISYIITNFRVSSNVANCGTLTGTETFVVIFRKNQVDTSLTGSCAAGASAGSSTLDTDIVSVSAGDRLSISISVTGTILQRQVRLGVTATGIVSTTFSDNIGDPLKVSCTPNQAFPGTTIRCLIAESLMDGTGRTGNAANTNIDIRDASNSVVVSNGHPTEWQHGIYYYDFTPSTSGFFSVGVETIDIATGNSIPGIYTFYVQEGWSTLDDINDVRDDIDLLYNNNTNYHNHINTHLHSINMTVMGDLMVNNTEVLNAIGEHRDRSFEFNMDVTLLLFAIAFFVVMAETRSDALYWFLATILSIYLLINRDGTVIPVGVYVGWIFVCLYQTVSLLMTKRAQNLSNTEE